MSGTSASLADRGPAGGRPTLLGVPFDAKSSYLRGAAEAPARIREALRSSGGNLWTEEMIDLGAAGALGDAGDTTVADGDHLALIERAVARVLEGGGRPIVLGGDHSISYPILRTVRRHHPRLAVLHFDAHPDLYDEFEGDRLSHATPFARSLEEKLADRLVQVGIRAMTGEQWRQAERFGVEVYDMRRLEAGERPSVDGPVYLSIDLDALDPAFAPGVSHREPGGLAVREILTMIQHLEGPIVGADIVEYNPRQDPTGITAAVCAKLVKEVAGAMIHPRRPRNAVAATALRPEELHG